ncbi:hypothetical protein AADC60_15465 [Cytobacillus pseudoceanisediminis]|uniref:Uncharacterized protein n=1 Tax=Cytobacillus pseudoceanisediminis TaxID=3051614 RepID=A0ABZ2ZCV2_9BACI|nr:hypothetical protein [Cytobacillus oceanisediminis]
MKSGSAAKLGGFFLVKTKGAGLLKKDDKIKNEKGNIFRGI